MTKIDWKQKLSSRKLWAALAAFVSSLLFAFNVADSDIAQVTSIIMAAGALIAYIFSEGWVDANRSSGDTYISNFNGGDDTDA